MLKTAVQTPDHDYVLNLISTMTLPELHQLVVKLRELFLEPADSESD